MDQQSRVLTSEQLAPPLPGAWQLALTRWLLLLEAQVRLVWPFYCGMGLFIAAAWLGLFTLLPVWLHVLLLAGAVVGGLYSLRHSGAAWRLPSVAAASRRLEAANHLPHLPYADLVARPVNSQPDKGLHGAWQTHQQRARNILKQLRLPRLTISLAGTDRYHARWLTLAALIISGFIGYGQLGARLQQAVIPATPTPTITAAANPVSGWLTPPAYTGLPPLLLAEIGKPLKASPRLRVPQGSAMVLRVQGGDKTPELRLDKGRIPFTSTGTEHSVSMLLPATDTLTIKQGWHSLAEWQLAIVPDMPPTMAWQTPPLVKDDGVALDYNVRDDYGVQHIELTLKLAVSTVGLPTEPQIIALPTRTQPQFAATTQIPLADSLWAGMPVIIQATATDHAGQQAATAPVTLTLPEHSFKHPVAQALATMRRALLQDAPAAWRTVIGQLLTLSQASAAYGDNPAVYLGLRSAAVRMYLDKDREQLTAITTLLWHMALAIDTNGLAEATAALRHAQQELAQALANRADPAILQQKMAQLEQALADYMQQLARTLPPEANDIPPEMLEQAGKNLAAELQQRLEEIKTLSETGAHEAAAQKMQELQNMLEGLRNAKPMSAEQKADLQAMKQARDLIKAQEELQQRTAETARTTPPESQDQAAADLARQQGELRQKLGDIVNDLASRHPEPPEQMATADQGMKDAKQNLAQQTWDEAQAGQSTAVQALKELANKMQQALQQQLMVLPMGQGKGSPTPRNPFGKGQEDGGRAVNGDVKVPDQQEQRSSRKILDELRRRSGDYTRPKDERGYIERLLEKF